MSKQKRSALQAFTEHLNNLYADIYGFEEVLDNFSHYYKTDSMARRKLQVHYSNHTLGSLQRKHDPIAFRVQFNDWLRDRKK